LGGFFSRAHLVTLLADQILFDGNLVFLAKIVFPDQKNAVDVISSVV
jgi:hypothetical protein